MMQSLRATASSDGGSDIATAMVQGDVAGLEIVAGESTKDAGVPVFRVYSIGGTGWESEPVQVGELAYQTGIAQWVFTAVRQTPLPSN